MLIINSLFLSGSLLGLASGASISLDVDLEGVDTEKAARVRELIAADTREKRIHDLNECIPRDMEYIPIKGSGEGIPYHGDGSVEIDDEYYHLVLSDHWYMPELREMTRSFLAGPSIRFQLASEECAKRVDIDAFGTLPVLARWVDWFEEAEEVETLLSSDLPNLLRAIRGFHEMGLAVDFDHIKAVQIFGDSDAKFGLELDPAYQLRMLGRHDRAGDMRKLVGALKSLQLGVLIDEWDEKLEWLTSTLGEVPLYDAWITVLSSRPNFFGAEEMIAKAVKTDNPEAICHWISLIRKNYDEDRNGCSYKNIDEQWRCLFGPQLVEFVRRTRANRPCQSSLADVVVDQVKLVYRLTGSVQFGIWLHSQLADWEHMKLCSHLKDSLNMPFAYVVCPRELFWEPKGVRRTSHYSVGTTTGQIETLWSLLHIPELAEEFKDNKQRVEDAFYVAANLLEHNSDIPHLDNIQTMCNAHKRTLIKLASGETRMIRLATAYGVWEDDDALKKFLNSRMASVKPFWEEGSCGYFAQRLQSVTEEPYRHLLHRYVLKCAVESWVVTYYRTGPIGLQRFAASLPGLADSGVCSESLMEEFMASEEQISTNIEPMWMCVNKRWGDIFCRSDQAPLKSILADYAKKGVSFSTLLAEFGATRMLESIYQCTEMDRSRAVGTFLDTFRDIQITYNVPDSELGAMVRVAGENFCHHNDDVLGKLRGSNAQFARMICADSPFAKHFTRKQILDSTITAWESSINVEPKGLRSFAQSFTPLAESDACEGPVLRDYTTYQLAIDGFNLIGELWVCGTEIPVEAVCHGVLGFPILVRQYRAKGVGLAELVSDFEATGILRLVDQCARTERENAISSSISLFREIQQIYELTDSQLRSLVASRDQIDYFCRYNQDVLENSPEHNLVIVFILCPNTPRSLQVIQRIVTSIPRPPRSMMLRVRRDHAFTDALTLLNDKFVEAFVPAGVVLEGESPACTMQEWLRLAGQEAASLLFTEEGREIRVNLPEQYYYGFGRLIALALIHEGTLTMEFPSSFFRELLTPRSENDQSAMRPIDIIRQGLEYFYPITRILQHVNPDEFGIMLT